MGGKLSWVNQGELQQFPAFPADSVSVLPSQPDLSVVQFCSQLNEICWFEQERGPCIKAGTDLY